MSRSRVVFPRPLRPMTKTRSLAPMLIESRRMSGRSGRVAERQVADVEGVLVVARLLGEGELEGLDGLELVALLHLLERLDARLDEAAEAGLGPEAGDEQVHLLHLPLVVDPGLLVDLLLGRDLLVVLPRVALDLADLAPVDAEDVGDDVVHEAAVVGDEQELARPGGQEALQPADGGDVEVVARLVEQEHLVVADQDLGQVEPDLVAARELRRALLEVGRLEAQAGQDLFDPPDLVRGVVGQGLGRLGQDGRLAEADPLLDVADAVLAGLGDGPVVGLLLPGDHPEEGRLAVAVAADDADPLLAVDLEADGVEEALFSVALREIVDDDHGVVPVLVWTGYYSRPGDYFLTGSPVTILVLCAPLVTWTR